MAIDLEQIKQRYSDIRPDGARYGYHFDAEHAEQLANDIDKLILEVELLRALLVDAGNVIHGEFCTEKHWGTCALITIALEESV